MFDEITPSELARRLGGTDEPLVVDVREPDEVAAWAFPEAVNIPLGELSSRAHELPRAREVITVCASGSRSATAAATLSAGGWRVANLAGGMAAWARLYDAAVVEVEGAKIVQVRRRAKGCLSYLVGSGGEAFVVDPSIEVTLYRQLADQLGWRITRVFDTHLHADHLSGARDLAAQTGATLHLNPADTFEFTYTPLADGDRFALPGGVEVSVATLHTPGHTEGSTVYLVGGGALLSGDTLFVDGVGRPDLAERAEEFARNLHRSLREQILVLGDEVTVLPAHYGEGVRVRAAIPVAATLGELRASLVPLQLDEEPFVAWAVARTTDRPPNYARIITANMGRAAEPPAVLQRLEDGPNRCSA